MTYEETKNILKSMENGTYEWNLKKVSSKYYTLVNRLDRAEWNKVKNYFFYQTDMSVLGGDSEESAWVTSKVSEVCNAMGWDLPRGYTIHTKKLNNESIDEKNARHLKYLGWELENNQDILERLSNENENENENNPIEKEKLINRINETNQRINEINEEIAEIKKNTPIEKTTPSSIEKPITTTINIKSVVMKRAWEIYRENST